MLEANKQEANKKDEIETTSDRGENIENHELQVLKQQLAKLEQQLKEVNNKKEDVLHKSIKEEATLKEEYEKKEALNNSYLDILSNFKMLYKEDSDRHLQVLKNITNTEDRCNALAKGIIRKVYGDTEYINEQLESFKASVVNTDSAFYAKYQEAIKKALEDRSAFNEQLFNPSAKEISAQDMKKMLYEALDYRSKDKGLNALKVNKLIATN